MDTRYLPSLKKITVSNFSLYPGDLNFTYDFVNGINLIIGGNGLGKTTFLNLIKYALIGLYRKGIDDVKRREFRGVEYRYEKRVPLPYTYFSGRMDDTFELNDKAEVSIVFELNNVQFEVTRTLSDPKITKVVVNDSTGKRELEGDVILQVKYDEMLSDQKKKAVAANTLQGRYEFEVGRLSNHDSFENLIFLVNDVLFFNESRKTIMWDAIIQSKLSSKYFIDPKLDKLKEKHERDGVYYNSLSNHQSEEIKAINKIFTKITSKDSEGVDMKKLVDDVAIQKNQVDKLQTILENIHAKRDRQEVETSKLYSDKNRVFKKIEDLEDSKRKEELLLFEDLFKKVTPKYYDYLKFLKSSGDCPLCNNVLEEQILLRIKDNDSGCMMCGNDIRSTNFESENLSLITLALKEDRKVLRSFEKDILTKESGMKELDGEFMNASIGLNHALSKLRKMEYLLQSSQSEGSSTNQGEYSAMLARIAELEKEKTESKEKSKKAYSEANKINREIDIQRLDSRAKLSGIFNDFGQKFLGVECELVYEDPKDEQGKRYLPKINGIERFHEEELSESQRFFIDQSFRMSLLSFFNEEASFFMCETPDSSLDISYEKNAAKIFLEYVKKPSQLILTSNFNNSEFLEYLISEAKEINYVNLLKIGRGTDIQRNSAELIKTSEKIEALIHGKTNS